MQTQDILCLANSHKHQARCVAGLTRDGIWIRPVSETEDGAISAESCMLDTGRPIAPLDVVRIPFAAPAPRLHQPENWIISDSAWKLVRSREIAEVHGFLESSTAATADLFGTRTDRVTWSQIQQGPPSNSLALVKAVRPTFFWSPRNPTQRRVIFSFQQTEYDLPITFDFDLPRLGEQRHNSECDWYLTVSLGEPFAAQGYDCFKLVAGALEIPQP